MGLEAVRNIAGAVRGTSWDGASVTAADVLVGSDVVIVGAGPVGSTLALSLSRAGLRPSIVDLRPTPSRVTQLNVAPTSIDVLHEHGARRTLAGLDPIVAFDEFDAASGAVTRTQYSDTFDPRRAVPGNGLQAVLDALNGADGRTWGRSPIGAFEANLRADLRESGDVPALFGARLVGIENKHPGAVRYTLEDAAGNRQALDTGLLVNATGSRPIPGLARNWEMSQHHVSFIGGKFDPTSNGVEHTSFMTSGPDIGIALRGNEHSIVWRKVPHLGDDLDRSAAADQVNETAERLGVSGRVAPDELIPLRVTAGRNLQPVDGGVVEVGDASRIPNFRTSSGYNTGAAVDVDAVTRAVVSIHGGADRAATLGTLAAELRRANAAVFAVNERQLVEDATRS